MQGIAYFCHSIQKYMFENLSSKLDRAFKVLKGQGSIQNGILLCNQFDIKYTSSSRNMKREQGLYVYEEDKVTGRQTNVPVDRNNHSFDAARYAIYSKYFREGK